MDLTSGSRLPGLVSRLLGVVNFQLFSFVRSLFLSVTGFYLY